MTPEYEEGAEAAGVGAPQYCCPYPESELFNRCQWMAGYHDNKKRLNNEKNIKDYAATQRAADFGY